MSVHTIVSPTVGVSAHLWQGCTFSVKIACLEIQTLKTILLFKFGFLLFWQSLNYYKIHTMPSCTVPMCHCATSQVGWHHPGVPVFLSRDHIWKLHPPKCVLCYEWLGESHTLPELPCSPLWDGSRFNASSEDTHEALRSRLSIWHQLIDLMKMYWGVFVLGRHTRTWVCTRKRNEALRDQF